MAGENSKLDNPVSQILREIMMEEEENLVLDKAR